MKTKVAIALILVGGILAATIAILQPSDRLTSPEPEASHTVVSSVPPDETESAIPEPVPAPQPVAVTESIAPAIPEPAAQPAESTNKLERLTQIRETFRKLAAGDRTTAMRAAKQITDETERETALLTLVTEWTQGELRPPRMRAHVIDVYGVEAGLGVELAKDAELAMLWANELTEGAGRAAILQQIARLMVATDPASALAVSEQLPESDRRQFFDALFADWASKDTSTALQWAEQFPDAADREAIIQAIRTSAPVGIGAALRMQDGYAVINELVPGTPAALDGQLRPGDRIVALAQGNNQFMDAQGVPLAEIVQMVRGAPGTLLQLQVLPADAPPNSMPRTVSIIRDQIKFKR
jgi:hypothetical protein